MLKRSMILLLVLVMLVSFSAAVIAEDNEDLEEGRAINNSSGVEILVDENDNVKEIKFLGAGSVEDAIDKGNTDRPTNPIAVAGN